MVSIDVERGLPRCLRDSEPGKPGSTKFSAGPVERGLPRCFRDPEPGKPGSTKFSAGPVERGLPRCSSRYRAGRARLYKGGLALEWCFQQIQRLVPAIRVLEACIVVGDALVREDDFGAVVQRLELDGHQRLGVVRGVRVPGEDEPAVALDHA